MKTREQAAFARRAGVTNLADRPRQRRCSAETGAPALATVRARMELREPAESGRLSFEGYASVTETGYEMWDWYGPYTEIVSAGAFTDTLNRVDLDVPLVLQHQQLRRIARTTNGSLILAEDETGLLVRAPELDPADHDVAYIAPKLRAGLIDEMSFAFRIDSGRWSPDYSEFRIERVDIHRGDVAIVGYGASPTTSAELLELAELLPEREVRAALAALNLRYLTQLEEPLMATI